MAKTPFKMKYTNGKKADTTAFPFKAEASPVKFAAEAGAIANSGGGGGGGRNRNRDGSEDWKDDIGGMGKIFGKGGFMKRLKEKISGKAEKIAEEKVEKAVDMGAEGTGDGLV